MGESPIAESLEDRTGLYLSTDDDDDDEGGLFRGRGGEEGAEAEDGSSGTALMQRQASKYVPTLSTVASIAFGCGSSNNGVGFSEAAGFVGLGRGKLSLISQLGILTFSFCFTSFGSPKKGSLLLGSLPPSANPNSSSPPSTVSTPILLNSFRPSFYYISLKGITIGTTRLDIPSSAFAIRNDGSGGMIIDSGTSITFLEYAAYAKVEEAFSSQIKNLR
ncbi:hypothetical protein Cni_G17847 [Canna indica]|uniref:Peptidase A1 domain-containing protein n=1 Tax=Canna indica TaxID=4628 RepID=A0AAQ3KID2_9LILI|nr:hypothetical protein Cni_G17847 [Canna indica]